VCICAGLASASSVDLDWVSALLQIFYEFLNKRLCISAVTTVFNGRVSPGGKY
jgi:hypothetical protein